MIAREERLTCRHRQRMLNGALQLAHVARPIVIFDPREGVVRKIRRVAARGSSQGRHRPRRRARAASRRHWRAGRRRWRSTGEGQWRACRAWGGCKGALTLLQLRSRTRVPNALAFTSTGGDHGIGYDFTVDNSGTVTRMRPGAPLLEADIQGLIARHPDMIGQEGDLLSVCQEASIADSEGGSGRWSLDNLFVTKSAVPVLVECKRASDPRIRREVVAQMFEYAANCTNWRDGEMARLFADSCAGEGRAAAAVLENFLGDATPLDDFWSRVDANLKSGNIRLLFVADRIPPELARIVEFLNEQMRAEVLAIELNWFVDTGGARALVPRVIGATERATAIVRLRLRRRSLAIPRKNGSSNSCRIWRDGNAAGASVLPVYTGVRCRPRTEKQLGQHEREG